MGDVFISYARTDQPIARRVAKALSDRGFDVWWDDQLPAHKAYSEIIEQRLRDAKAVVVLWSAAAASSQWVRAEADYARNANKLVQAQVDAGIPPMPFNQIQCADLKAWRGSGKHPGWAKLVGSVEALVSGKEPVDTPPTSAGWRDRLNLRWAAAAAVALVIAAVAAFYLLAESPAAKRPVLAVLPFESLDQRDASLVSGIWEDTRQALSRNPQLLVLGPHTSEQLAEGEPGAARKAADYLVEASVRAIGDRVRVSANLTRTEDGSQLWSENFDRRLDDVFRLQSEIAREIEGRIRGRLATGGGIQPENIATSGEVYALYSDARAKIRRRQTASYVEAQRQLEQVVRTDPNFAPGWATLAVSKGLGFASAEALSTAEADARRAIRLAPNLAAGHAALGFTLQKGPVAQAALRRALQLDPNDVEAINWLANSLDPKTHYQDKLRLYTRVVELEPLWWPAVLNKLNLLLDRGDMAALDEELKRVEAQGDPMMAAAIKVIQLDAAGDLSGAVNVGLAAYRSTKPHDRDLVRNFVWGALLKLGLFSEADALSAPMTDFVPYLRLHDPRALTMIESRMGPKQFWSFGALGVIGTRVYLLNGRGPKVAALYRAVAASPEAFERQLAPGFLPEVAPSVALALRQSGDAVEAARLLDLALSRANELGGTRPSHRVTLARIHAAKGESERAVQFLSEAVRRNWLPQLPELPADIQQDPALAELKADPRFQALRRRILGHLAKERAELGAISLN